MTAGENKAAEAGAGLKVGDVVWYVPHASHSFNCNANNEYPWVIGVRQPPRLVEDPSTGRRELIEEVVEVEEGHLHRSVLPAVYRHPNSREEREKLVPLRPKRPWQAVVRAVHPDGTVDLDVDSNVGAGMVTLHYRRVKVDLSRSLPHTCYREVPDGRD